MKFTKNDNKIEYKKLPEENQEIEEHKISIRRVGVVFAMLVIFAAGTVFLAMQNRVLIDELITILIFNISFFGFFIIYLMRHRISGRLRYTGTSYQRLLLYMILGWLVTMLGVWIPEFLMPVGILIILYASYFTDIVTLSMGIYFMTSLCLLCGRGTYTMYCYNLLLVINAFLAGYLRDLPGDRRLIRFMVLMLTIVFNAFVPVMFYYFTYGEIQNSSIAIPSALIAVLEAFFAWKIMPKLHEWNLTEMVSAYETILDDDYSLIIELKRYSMAEYNHARRVSQLSMECARQINANVLASGCGGMYYRLGKTLGRPEIQNAVTVATNHCFPPDVIAILEEYEGKQRIPQSPESAIVHMVNSLVTKIELMDSDTMSSSWNQEMLIYQTLNEYSNSGIYDEAKLSMNQFLRIRETLVHEGI